MEKVCERYPCDVCHPFQPCSQKLVELWARSGSAFELRHQSFCTAPSSKEATDDNKKAAVRYQDTPWDYMESEGVHNCHTQMSHLSSLHPPFITSINPLFSQSTLSVMGQNQCGQITGGTTKEGYPHRKPARPALQVFSSCMCCMYVCKEG